MVAASADEAPGQHLLVMCDARGAPVESPSVPFHPIHLSMTATFVAAASHDSVFVWRYTGTLLHTAGFCHFSPLTDCAGEMRRHGVLCSSWIFQPTAKACAANLQGIMNAAHSVCGSCRVLCSERMHAEQEAWCSQDSVRMWTCAAALEGGAVPSAEARRAPGSDPREGQCIFGIHEEAPVHRVHTPMLFFLHCPTSLECLMPPLHQCK